LMAEAARLIQERFELVSVQIYLVGAGRRNLVLRARSGLETTGMMQVGGRMPIAAGTTIGTAAVEQKVIVAAGSPYQGASRRRDVLAQATEIAIPLVSGEQLTGIVQLYSNQP